MEPPGAVLTPQGASAQNRSTNTSVVATTRDVWVAHRPRGGGSELWILDSAPLKLKMS